ncbi:MAG: HlyD family efflux transporter periplasmic adaptor subunit [Phycisphaerae bacterium]|jgi:multidrug resistance efflux pump
MDVGRTIQQDSHPRTVSAGDLVDRISRFDGPPELFLINLLAVQCHIASADAGAILRGSGEKDIEAVAVYPPLAQGATAPVWLAQSAELSGQILKAGVTAIRPLRSPEELYGQPAKRHLVMVPLRGGNQIRGLEAFVVSTDDLSVLTACCDRLELTTGLLSLYEMRLTLQRRQLDLRRLRVAMETLSAVNEHNRFTGAGMTLCNEMASRWNCERVGLGFLKGRYVHLKAMSHTEKFNRKMKVVQDIEAAMEECLDQNVEIIYPADPQATYVSRAAAELSKRHGPHTMVSFPLRLNGEELAVVTMERPADQPFTLDELEALRLTCDLTTPRLAGLHDSDVWFGAALAKWLRKGLAGALSPKHTWAKALAIAAAGLLAFVFFAKGDFQAEAPFALQATKMQVVPAPFEGYLKSVAVRPADYVEAGASLAELDTIELRLQLGQARAEKAAYLKQADAALATAGLGKDGATKMAERQIAEASAQKVDAQIKVLEYRIAKGSIVTPIAGFVVTGDLEKQIGAPVKTGDVMFEIAPLESLRAELSVPEDQIADVQVGQRGDLATVGHPESKLSFVVERINPVAEVDKQNNVFKVRVKLENVDLKGAESWLRPGMEGVAKVDIGKKSYAWLWTRRLTNWVRMKLWI